jgi:hypothetical protein
LGDRTLQHQYLDMNILIEFLKIVGEAVLYAVIIAAILNLVFPPYKPKK